MRIHLRRRPVVAAACCFAVLAAAVVPAVAQENGFGQQIDDLRNAIGFGKDRPSIDFSERPPLAVPPTYDLPPPVSAVPPLGVKDPDVEARRRALSDSRRPVPPTDPGASAAGAYNRAYLVDPPSGFRDPKAVAAALETDKADRASAVGDAKPARKHRKRKPAPDAASAGAAN